jgi:hypothetical protein
VLLGYSANIYIYINLTDVYLAVYSNVCFVSAFFLHCGVYPDTQNITELGGYSQLDQRENMAAANNSPPCVTITPGLDMHTFAYQQNTLPKGAIK